MFESQWQSNPFTGSGSSPGEPRHPPTALPRMGTGAMQSSRPSQSSSHLSTSSTTYSHQVMIFLRIPSAGIPGPIIGRITCYVFIRWRPLKFVHLWQNPSSVMTSRVTAVLTSDTEQYDPVVTTTLKPTYEVDETGMWNFTRGVDGDRYADWKCYNLTLISRTEQNLVTALNKSIPCDLFAEAAE